MKKIDIVLALISGEGMAWLFLWLVKKLPMVNLPFLNWFLPIFFPILAVFGIWISYLIGKKYLFVYQLAKFFLIGAFFAIFDLIIFNALIGYFGISKEEVIKYALFVAISFIIVTTVKYVAEKYWAFEKTGGKEIEKEFGKFFIITIISGGIQVVVSSFVFKAILPFAGMSELVSANIGKIGGIIVASAWSFLGYKFIVFKK